METFSVKTIKLIRKLIKKCEVVKEKKDSTIYLPTYYLSLCLHISHYSKTINTVKKLTTHNWLAITVTRLKIGFSFPNRMHMN